MAFVAFESFGKLIPGTGENLQMMTDIFDDNPDQVDLLGELKYVFAIGDIDPRVGRIRVSQIYWPSE